MPHLRSFALAAFVALVAPLHALAQGRPEPTVEAVGGYTGFFDESVIEHAAAGLRGRASLTERVAVGPELLVMRGPGSDRDVVVTASMTIDILKSPRGANRLVVPYATVGGGALWHWGPYMSREPVRGRFIYWGGGTRIRVGPRLFVAPEFRMGFEPHVQFTASLGYRFVG